MSRPSYVSFAVDKDRTVWVNTTQDPDVALLVDEQTFRRKLTVVRIHEFPTMARAHRRLARIFTLPQERRRRLIERRNPEYRDVSRGLFPSTWQAKADSVPPPPPPEEPGSSAVGAKLPNPVFPISGADAKLPPR